MSLPRIHPRRGVSYPVRHEPFWGWAVRPASGWRSRQRWWSPPIHFTRHIPADAETAAEDWALERMGL